MLSDGNKPQHQLQRGMSQGYQNIYIKIYQTGEAFESVDDSIHHDLYVHSFLPEKISKDCHVSSGPIWDVRPSWQVVNNHAITQFYTSLYVHNLPILSLKNISSRICPSCMWVVTHQMGCIPIPSPSVCMLTKLQGSTMFYHWNNWRDMSF